MFSTSCDMGLTQNGIITLNNRIWKLLKLLIIIGSNFKYRRHVWLLERYKEVKQRDRFREKGTNAFNYKISSTRQ